jgi:hypothetical protein
MQNNVVLDWWRHDENKKGKRNHYANMAEPPGLQELADEIGWI